MSYDDCLDRENYQNRTFSAVLCTTAVLSYMHTHGTGSRLSFFVFFRVFLTMVSLFAMGLVCLCIIWFLFGCQYQCN